LGGDFRQGEGLDKISLIAIIHFECRLLVRIIGRDISLDGFARRHPTARAPLEAWVLLIGNKSFRHFPDLKHVFPKADYVKAEDGV
jgi:hypothetical protein